MTWRLDPPIRIGHRIFAALTKVDISTHCAGKVILATADKRPRTILMLEGDKITALDLDGHVHTPANTADAYPIAVAQLRRFCTSTNSSDPDQ
jgi:hypothetical protein